MTLSQATQATVANGPVKRAGAGTLLPGKQVGPTLAGRWAPPAPMDPPRFRAEVALGPASRHGRAVARPLWSEVPRPCPQVFWPDHPRNRTPDPLAWGTGHPHGWPQ